MALSLADLVKKVLIERNQAAITAYDLERILRQIYAGTYPSQEAARVRKAIPSESDISKALERLDRARVVRKDPDFRHVAFQVFDVIDQSAEAVCCAVDPFCYVSHFSALQNYGLTERSPVDLVLTRPADALWRQTRDETEKESEFPMGPRPRLVFPDHVRNRSILMHETRHPGYFRQIGDGQIRMATIGQTFLDTVIRPAWCGGMSHVLGIWEREAEPYLDDIIAAVSTYPVKLPKVRAGYILDEVVGIKDERILAWRAFAQRGSSQKLDPENPYAPIYSESWMLSINV